MKIVIFGATGSIGSQLVKQALDYGHKVTAFARHAEKLAGKHPDLTVVSGDVKDSSSVEKVIAGQDAVLVSIGAGRKGQVRAAGTQNIINAMRRVGVNRLICQSSLGVGDSRANLNAFWKYIMFGLLLRPAYADHTQQEKYVQQSDLDWTIVRPGAFIEGELTGHYRHGFASSDRTTQLKISRNDVADFMLKQLFDMRYLHQSPGLSY